MVGQTFLSASRGGTPPRDSAHRFRRRIRRRKADKNVRPTKTTGQLCSRFPSSDLESLFGGYGNSRNPHNPDALPPAPAKQLRPRLPIQFHLHRRPPTPPPPPPPPPNHPHHPPPSPPAEPSPRR